MIFVLPLCFFIWHKANSQIGNNVSNGSFELIYDCYPPFNLDKAYSWCNMGFDTTKFAGALYSTGATTNCINAPYTDVGFQFPRTGKVFYRFSPYCTNPCSYYYARAYPKNRLKSTLSPNKTYCVKFYVCLEDTSPYAISNFGVYFGGNSTDTIKYANGPITYLIPQIKNPILNIIKDTMNWVPVTGTFVATGTEKYLIIGNFDSDAITTKSLVIPNYAYTWSEYFIDDVSCIEVDLPAYAGPDKSIVQGDSAFIGRAPDFATDAGCTWYKLPNMSTPINTISGMWVKPAVTTTYVVRQILDCSTEKWDTVVIYEDHVGLEKLNLLQQDLKIYPVPASENLEIIFNNDKLFDFKSLIIYNDLGQILREEEIIFKDKKISLKINELPEGIYSIRLKSNTNQTVSKRFMIAR